jgi:DNA mismatch repair protein MSH4
MPGLKLGFNASRGYHLVIPGSVQALPAALVQAVKNRATIAAATEELLSLSERAKESLFNIYVMLHVIVGDLAGAVRAHVGALFKAAESVALLDLLASFVSLVVTAPDPTAWCRPIYSENGPTVITRGRHLLVERALHSPYVPNDVYLGPGANMQVRGRQGLTDTGRDAQTDAGRGGALVVASPCDEDRAGGCWCRGSRF